MHAYIHTYIGEELSVWDYKSKTRVNSFANGNSVGSRCTSLLLLDATARLTSSLLVVGSSEGNVRIWPWIGYFLHPTSYILLPTSYFLHPTSYRCASGAGGPRWVSNSSLAPGRWTLDPGPSSCNTAPSCTHAHLLTPQLAGAWQVDPNPRLSL